MKPKLHCAEVFLVKQAGSGICCSSLEFRALYRGTQVRKEKQNTGATNAFVTHCSGLYSVGERFAQNLVIDQDLQVRRSKVDKESSIEQAEKGAQTKSYC